MSHRRIAFVLGICLFLLRPLGAAEFDVDQAMLQDPFLPPRPIERFFPSPYRPLWRQALQHPERDLQRQTAETIARAHQRGVPELQELIPDLVAALEIEDQAAVVKRSICRALVVLEARDQSDVLWKHAQQHGIFLAQLVEPALAEWDYKPARETWRSRLGNPSVGRSLRVLALESLMAVKDTASVAEMITLVHDPAETADLRVAAARSAALIQSSGLLEDARKLLAGAESPRTLSSILAMELLATHSGSETEQFIIEQSQQVPTIAAVIGLKRLLEINPEAVALMADFLLPHTDTEMRRIGCQALAAVPNPERCQLLCGKLGDPIDSIRRTVRLDLLRLAANQELRPTILESATLVLSGDRWRALEQAGLLLGALDHEPVAERLTDLLDYERPEVYVAAAWALRELQVPEMLPAMLERALKNKQWHIEKGYQGIDEQQNQLFQAFGIMQYEPANQLMRTYIPKGTVGPREAAIWGLGHIYTDQNPMPLVEQLRERLADEDLMDPELLTVKQMAAVSIGRMQGKQALPTVIAYFNSESPDTMLGQACGWARQRMTGETYPPPTVLRRADSGFFLEPLNPTSKPTTSSSQ